LVVSFFITIFVKQSKQNNMNFTLEILREKFSENRTDSFWYHNDDIAKIGLLSGNKVYAESRGEIRVQFEEDGEHFKNGKAVEEAFDRNLTDEDLAKIGEFDGWHNNNWFAVIKVDINGKVISDDLAIAHDYDEIIELLKECAKEEQDKEYS